MTAIGETLRCERMRRNLDLEQISRELKISPRFLDAIESEQFDRLPGRVFAKSFVRQYARLLGLDEEGLAAEIQQVLEPEPEPAPPAPVAPVGAKSYSHLPRMRAWEMVGDGDRAWRASPLRALLSVVAVVALCAGVYSWWQARRSAAPPAPAATAERRPAAEPSRRPAAATPPLQTAAAPPPQALGSADRSASEPFVPGSANPQGPGAAPAASNAPVQVQLTADEPVWVRARSDGKFLFSGTLEPNQSRNLDAGGTVELLLGNAGGIRISVNGKPIGAVGPKGQVRTVQLTSGGFTIVPPRPAASVPIDPL
jgi:cytoskeleton protein RodZ